MFVRSSYPVLCEEVRNCAVSDENDLHVFWLACPRNERSEAITHISFWSLKQPITEVSRPFRDLELLVGVVAFLLLVDLVSYHSSNPFLWHRTYLRIPTLDHEPRIDFHNVELQVITSKQLWQ